MYHVPDAPPHEDDVLYRPGGREYLKLVEKYASVPDDWETAPFTPALPKKKRNPALPKKQ
jgi:hypothetical protein